MKKDVQDIQHDEPVILSLEAYLQAAIESEDYSRVAGNDDNPPEADAGQADLGAADKKEADAYWAGRGLAKRLSARWAA